MSHAAPTAPTRVETLPPEDGVAAGASALRAAIRAAPAHDGLLRVEAPVGAVDPLAWLAGAAEGARCYFETRDGARATAGVGAARTLEPAAADAQACIAALQGADPEGALRYVLTCRFAEAAGESAWAPFGALRLVLPRVELRREGADAVLAVHVGPGAAEREDAVAVLEAAATSTSREGAFHADVVAEAPDADTWRGAIERTLEAIGEGHLEKCVLARTRTYALDRPVDPFGLLRAVARTQPDTFRFGIEAAPGRAFVGASPELLFERRGGGVFSEALAGTRRRPEDEAEGARLADELLASPKDRAEHEFVTQHVADALRPLLDGEPQIEGPTIRRLLGLQHLGTTVEGRLADKAVDAELLFALHPTPAVCGVPTEAARAAIHEHESFDRGLYCGAVGLVGRNETTVAVAIRSALCRGDRVTLLAGAGIVHGSVADAEWDETSDKMRPLHAVLRAGRAE